MTKQAEILKKKLENARRVAILGIGSDLRGDDIAGILTAQNIEKAIKSKKTTPELKVFLGETAPENLTGEIKRFNPSHLIIIDSAILNAVAGHIEILNPNQIGGTSFCTHSLPLKVMTDYLQESFKFEVITIGIQPGTLTFGAKASREVIEAVKQLSMAIVNLFKIEK